MPIKYMNRMFRVESYSNRSDPLSHPTQIYYMYLSNRIQPLARRHPSTSCPITREESECVLVYGRPFQSPFGSCDGNYFKPAVYDSV